MAIPIVMGNNVRDDLFAVVAIDIIAFAASSKIDLRAIVAPPAVVALARGIDERECWQGMGDGPHPIDEVSPAAVRGAQYKRIGVLAHRCGDVAAAQFLCHGTECLVNCRGEVGSDLL